MEKLKNHNNLGLKVLSLGIAILIWMLVTNTNDPVIVKRFSSIDVQVINEEALIDQGYAYSITEGDEVNVTVKGKQSIVSNLTESDVKATADLAKTTQWGSVPIDIEIGKFTEQLEISLGTVNTMKVEMEESRTVSIPVNVTIIGNPTSGHVVGLTSCTPNLITVSGPKSALADAKEIRANVDVGGLSSDVSKSCAPVLYDSDGNKIDNSQISFGDDNIIASVSIWKTKEIPVKMDYNGEPEKGYVLTNFEYEPKRIVVGAPDSILGELKKVTLDSISIAGYTADAEKTIDLTEAGVLPPHVVVADDYDSIKVKATIEKVITKKLKVASSKLTIKNKDSYSVEYKDKGSYTIEIEGAESLINSITIEKLTPWIDLSDCTGDMVGDHEIKVHVKEIKGVTVTSTSTAHILISE